MPKTHILEELVTRLQKAFGDDLFSVVLYGSAAVGDRHEHFSDYNVLCVLRQVTSLELARSEEIFRWFRDRDNPSPLLLSEDEVADSTDCFPIEFHDMKAQNRILYGRDVIGGLEIDDSFYRAQVEHELRAKLLRLRQKASGVLSDRDMLRGLLADSLSTFCVLLRHAMILKGEEAPLKKREIVAGASAAFGFDPDPFDRLLDFREQKIKPRDLDPVPVFESYLAAVTKVIRAVDGIAK
jgi:predicted nucleotidyltransferase